MSKILVIDDDEQMRDVLRQMLEVEGYEVAEAENGVQGCEVYKEFVPDLVIMDIIMPEKGGLETIIKLKQENPKVKIFAITGGGKVVKADFLGIAENIGAIRSFHKPIERNELVKAVKEVLAG